MKNLLLVGCLVLVVTAAWVLNPGSQFAGTDSQATQVITEISPGTQPWMQPLWAPSSRELETALFALQAVAGAAGVGYFFGVKRAHRRSGRSEKQ